MTSIGGAAFQGCSGFTGSLQIPDSVATIGSSAFYGCSGLTGSLQIPDSVTTIGSSAFYGCTGLTSVTVPDSVTSIGQNAFSGCNGIESIVLPFIGESRTASWQNAKDRITWIFNQNDSTVPSTLKTVKITDMDHIPDYAFKGCSNLTKVIIPETVTTIGSSAFYGCSGLTDLDYYSEAVPADSAFNGCTNLTVHLSGESEAVQAYFETKNIPYDFFPGVRFTLTLDANGGVLQGESVLMCNWLDLIALETPVWDGHIFSGWYLDEELTKAFDGVMPARSITVYAAWDKDIYTLSAVINTGYDESNVSGAGVEGSTYRIPANAKIKPEAPARDGFFFTGWYLDADCLTLFDGTMPYRDLTVYAGWQKETENITYILTDNGAVMTGFLEMEDLESYRVYLPETVGGEALVGIAENAFMDTGVREVYIPATVTDISPNAFKGSAVRNLYVHQGNPVYSAENGILYSADGSVLILCPPRGHTIVKIPDGVMAIGDYAFYEIPMTSVTLPESLLTIGNHSFAGTSIQELMLPANLTVVGERAFFGCNELYLVTISGSPESVLSDAFANCNPFMAIYGPVDVCPIHTALSNYWYNAYNLTVHYFTGTETNTVAAGTRLYFSNVPEAAENTEFTGWYTDEACTETFTDMVMPCADLTLWQGSRQILYFETQTDEESGNTAVRITGCGSASSEIVVPETLFGNPVTSIAAGSFSADYTQVEIPATVTEIEDEAFTAGTVLICAPDNFAGQWAAEHGFTVSEKRWTLKYVTGWHDIVPAKLLAGDNLVLPELVRDGYSLDGWFADEDFGQPVTESDLMGIGNRSIYALWTVVDEELAELSESFETIEEEDGTLRITAYTGNGGVVPIPASLHGRAVSGIDSNAFSLNNNITEISIPASVNKTGYAAFYGMNALTKVIWGTQTAIIPENAFANCVNLTEIILPEGVTTIEDGAFTGCKMQTISLPASLERIKPTALNGCTDLAEILVAGGNQYYESRDGVLYDTADDVLIRYPAAKEDSTYTVSAGSIGAWAFDGAENLKSIIVTDVWSFGEGTFSGCRGLDDIPTLDPMVTKLPDSCFRGCTGLTNVTLPASVKTLGKQVFANCSLETLTVTEKLSSIGEGAVGSGVVICGGRGIYAEAWCGENGTPFRVSGTVLPTTLSAEDIMLKRGEHTKLEVTASPDNADLSFLSMSSSDPSIVYLDADGTLYALAGGMASIYIRDPAGAFTFCTVTVEVDAAGVTLSQHELQLDDVTGTTKLNAAVEPYSATNKTLTWSSSDENVVTVSADGTVTMTGYGTAQISVITHNGLTDICQVECMNHPSTTLALPAALTRIEAEAFMGVTAKVIIVPASVTEIRSRAFADCPNLRLLVFLGTPKTIAGDYLAGCTNVKVEYR